MVRWSSFIPAGLKKSKVSVEYNKCDKNKDGDISKEEFNSSVPGPIRFFVGNKKLEKAVSFFDKNNDGKMSKQEIGDVLNDKFGISFEDASNMKAGELVDKIQDKIENPDKKRLP